MRHPLNLSASVWALLALLLGSSIYCLSPAWSADQKPLVINPTTGRQEQMQTGNNLLIPGTSTVTIGSLTLDRIPVIGASGLLTDTANFTFDSSRVTTNLGYTVTGTGVAATTNLTYNIPRSGHTTGYNGITLNSSGGGDSTMIAHQGSSNSSIPWALSNSTYIYAPTRLRMASGVSATGYMEVTGPAVSLGSGTTFTVNNTTPSTSTATGSVINLGGYASSQQSFFRGTRSANDTHGLLVNYFHNGAVDPSAFLGAGRFTMNTSGGTAGNSSFNAGVHGAISHSSAYTLAAGIGILSEVQTINASSVITNGSGFYFKNNAEVGTVTNKHAFYTEAVTGGGTNYAFRSAGAGLVSVGDTTDATSKDGASVVLEGGLGVEKSVYVGGVFAVTGAAGTYRNYGMFTNSLQRWGFVTNNAAETGGEAGSNLTFDRYSDTGSYIASWMTVTRSTGDISIASTTDSTSATTGSIVSEGGITSKKTVYMSTGCVIESSTATALLVGTGGTATRGSTVSSSAGVSGNYNGMFFNSNASGNGDTGAQYNTSLPTWRMGLGGGAAEWNGADNWSVARVAAGGTVTTPTILAKVDNAGNFTLPTVGSGIIIKEGTNAKMGVATLVGGTVTVNTTAVTASSRIYLTSNVDGGTPGFQRISARVAATSFTILSSSGTDTSQIAWMIVEPAP